MNRLIALIAILLMSIAACSATNWIVEDSVLVVKSSVRSIPARALADRTDFHTIRFEAGSQLTQIGEYAFLGCSNLRSVILPASVSQIGEGAFRECRSLESIAVPAKVRKLPRYVFSWCGSLKKVSLPSGLVDIGSGCFAYCRSLSSIQLPKRLAHVGANAFSFCSSLTEIVVPDAVLELESYAFSECVSLRRAQLPGNDKLLGELIFSGCQKLEEIVELSVGPPKFDCNSQLFEDNESFMYERCRLIVAKGCRSSYADSPGWKNFREIIPSP